MNGLAIISNFGLAFRCNDSRPPTSHRDNFQLRTIVEFSHWDFSQPQITDPPFIPPFPPTCISSHLTLSLLIQHSSFLSSALIISCPVTVPSAIITGM